jgi:hypothetical protein
MSETEAPIPLAELVEVTEITFSIEEAIATGKSISRDNVGAPPIVVGVRLTRALSDFGGGSVQGLRRWEPRRS